VWAARAALRHVPAGAPRHSRSRARKKDIIAAFDGPAGRSG
jgi:hypothetical protein